MENDKKFVPLKKLIEEFGLRVVLETEGYEDIQITTTESDGGNGNVPALVANIPIREVRH